MPGKIPLPIWREDYRPLALLNADFKLLARIIANGIRPWINDLHHPSQHCGVQDNNILGAISAIRDTISMTELTHIPLCIISLDFKGHSTTLPTPTYSQCYSPMDSVVNFDSD